MSEEKFADAAEYCEHLLNPPKVGGQYRDYSGFYICKFTEKPCIARRVDDISNSSDVFTYFHPRIDEKNLDSCPARNVSDDVAKAIINDFFRRKVLELQGNELE